MTKKLNTLYGICVLFIGIIGGIAGTAYALGADKQRINDTLSQHERTILLMRSNDISHEKAIQKELDRLIEVIASPITLLQSSISKLTSDVANIRTDVQVLKALMERMEAELKTLD